MKKCLLLLCVILMAGCQNGAQDSQALSNQSLHELQSNSRDFLASQSPVAGARVSDFKSITFTCKDGTAGGGVGANSLCIPFNDGYTHASKGCVDHKGLGDLHLLGACLVSDPPPERGIQGVTYLRGECRQPSAEFAKCGPIAISASFLLSGGPVCLPKTICRESVSTAQIVKSDASGHYKVNVTPGIYKLSALNARGGYLFNSLEVTVTANKVVTQDIYGEQAIVIPPPPVPLPEPGPRK